MALSKQSKIIYLSCAVNKQKNQTAYSTFFIDQGQKKSLFARLESLTKQSSRGKKIPSIDYSLLDEDTERIFHDLLQNVFSLNMSCSKTILFHSFSSLRSQFALRALLQSIEQMQKEYQLEILTDPIRLKKGPLQSLLKKAGVSIPVAEAEEEDYGLHMARLFADEQVSEKEDPSSLNIHRLILQQYRFGKRYEYLDGDLLFVDQQPESGNKTILQRLIRKYPELAASGLTDQFIRKKYTEEDLQKVENLLEMGMPVSQMASISQNKLNTQYELLESQAVLAKEKAGETVDKKTSATQTEPGNAFSINKDNTLDEKWNLWTLMIQDLLEQEGYCMNGKEGQLDQILKELIKDQIVKLNASENQQTNQNANKTGLKQSKPATLKEFVLWADLKEDLKKEGENSGILLCLKSKDPKKVLDSLEIYRRLSQKELVDQMQLEQLFIDLLQMHAIAAENISEAMEKWMNLSEDFPAVEYYGNHPVILQKILKESLLRNHQAIVYPLKVDKETLIPLAGAAGLVEKGNRSSFSEENDQVKEGLRRKIGSDSRFWFTPDVFETLDSADIDLLAHPDFSVALIKDMAKAFARGLDPVQIQEILDRNWNIQWEIRARLNGYLHISRSRRLLEEQYERISYLQYDWIANQNLSPAKMEAYLELFEEGLDEENLRRYFTRSMSLAQIEKQAAVWKESLKNQSEDSNTESINGKKETAAKADKTIQYLPVDHSLSAGLVSQYLKITGKKNRKNKKKQSKDQQAILDAVCEKLTVWMEQIPALLGEIKNKMNETSLVSPGQGNS